jgi:hypothetical protein
LQLQEIVTLRQAKEVMNDATQHLLSRNNRNR